MSAQWKPARIPSRLGSWAPLAQPHYFLPRSPRETRARESITARASTANIAPGVAAECRMCNWSAMGGSRLNNAAGAATRTARFILQSPNGIAITARIKAMTNIPKKYGGTSEEGLVSKPIGAGFCRMPNRIRRMEEARKAHLTLRVGISNIPELGGVS